MKEPSCPLNCREFVLAVVNRVFVEKLAGWRFTRTVEDPSLYLRVIYFSPTFSTGRERSGRLNAEPNNRESNLITTFKGHEASGDDVRSITRAEGRLGVTNVLFCLLLLILWHIISSSSPSSSSSS